MAAAPARPADQLPNIEADPDLFDASDSSLGDDISKYTASLTSSIERYPIENGRRYHAFKDGSYIMPNDESEQDRLDLSHQMFKITMRDKIYWAPIDKPARILDIGTGTGIWAIEMGDDFPDAEIIDRVPANVKFEVDDAEESWTFQHQFDFIHARYLAAAISDWEKLVRQCFENTKPGGWTEFQEYDLSIYSEDGSLTSEHAEFKWNNLGCGACSSFGKDPDPGQEVMVLLANVRKDFRDPKIHAQLDFHVAYGRKPTT
ncbi:hypothetical protein P7C71_g2270, partial [Lecanoromycetidae sp. Uapishka_2]